MQIDYLSIIVVGLVALFVGYFVAIFEGRGQEAPKDKKSEQPPAPVTAPKENSLLNLSLNNDNQPRLELDGQRADSSQLAPEQRKRLIELMVMMRPWIDASAPKVSAPVQPISPQPLPSAPITAPISQPAAKPAVSAPASTSKKEEAAPTSMVGQIDDILQTHLAGSPLANRAIRLLESPEGGVVVMVGLEKYGGVAEVPDPQVQSMIRLAIAEWEKRYTPGG